MIAERTRRIAQKYFPRFSGGTPIASKRDMMLEAEYAGLNCRPNWVARVAGVNSVDDLRRRDFQ